MHTYRTGTARDVLDRHACREEAEETASQAVPVLGLHNQAAVQQLVRFLAVLDAVIVHLLLSTVLRAVKALLNAHAAHAVHTGRARLPLRIHLPDNGAHGAVVDELQKVGKPRTQLARPVLELAARKRIQEKRVSVCGGEWWGSVADHAIIVGSSNTGIGTAACCCLICGLGAGSSNTGAVGEEVVAHAVCQVQDVEDGQHELIHSFEEAQSFFVSNVLTRVAAGCTCTRRWTVAVAVARAVVFVLGFVVVAAAVAFAVVDAGSQGGCSVPHQPCKPRAHVVHVGLQRRRRAGPGAAAAGGRASA